MTPEEFYAKYGLPLVRVVQLTINFEVITQVAPSRYLLGFIAGSSSVSVRPLSREAASSTGIVLSLNTDRFFNHRDHGGLVQMQWEGFSTFGSSELMIVEGFLPGPRIADNNRMRSQVMTREAYLAMRRSAHAFRQE